MERTLGAEIVRTFGTRMKKIYSAEETALPPQFARWLERLQRAEQELAARAGQTPPAGDAQG